jgi:hypothetical protein
MAYKLVNSSGVGYTASTDAAKGGAAVLAFANDKKLKNSERDQSKTINNLYCVLPAMNTQREYSFLSRFAGNILFADLSITHPSSIPLITLSSFSGVMEFYN